MKGWEVLESNSQIFFEVISRMIYDKNNFLERISKHTTTDDICYLSPQVIQNILLQTQVTSISSRYFLCIKNINHSNRTKKRMLIIKNRIYNFFSFDIVKVQIHKQWQWFVLYSVSRVLFFRSRHCLSLSSSLWRPLLSRILFFLRSDLFVLSTAEQDKKKEKKFFFRVF